MSICNSDSLSSTCSCSRAGANGMGVDERPQIHGLSGVSSSRHEGDCEWALVSCELEGDGCALQC